MCSLQGCVAVEKATRKSIINLCTKFQLDEEEFQSKLTAEEARLRSLLPPESAEGEGEAAEGEEGGASGTQAQGQAEEVAKQMAVVQYLRVSPWFM